jgi:Tfp pilus assembly protein PilX
MAAVLVSLTIILMVVLATLALATNSIKHSRRSQDTDLALAAARSGLNDLLAQLRGDPSYLEAITGPDAPYCQDRATGGPDGDQFGSQCGWGADTPVGWEEIGSGRQRYHYAITAYSATAEAVEVLSTGRAGQVYRALKGYLGREAGAKWLYFSDYELADPNDYTTYSTWVNQPSESVYGAGQLTSQGCGGGYTLGADLTRPGELGYRWQLGPASPVRRAYVNKGLSFPCAEPDFTAGDVLSGPVHSNDTIRSSGAQFQGAFSTSDPACRQASAADEATWGQCVNGAAVFSSAPVYRPEPLQLPDTEDPKAAAKRDGRGCLYQGPTRIVLDGAKMRVWSRDTAHPAPHCGSAAALASSAGAAVDLPADGLVYVDVADESVAHAQIPSGGIGDGLPLGTYQGAPPGPGVSYSYEKAMLLPGKRGGVGNLFIEGVAAQSLTVGASGAVVLTGDLMAQDPAKNLLGVISDRSIEIFNPIMVTYRSVRAGSGHIWSRAGPGALDASWAAKHSLYDGDAETLTIEAAMYAATAGFGLQNWKEGGRLGTLRVHGSITQRFRGIVGYHDDQTGQLHSGYRKEYVFNQALLTASPRLFAPVKNGSWVIAWLERATPPEEVKR